jgi:hypothetical protein
MGSVSPGVCLGDGEAGAAGLSVMSMGGDCNANNSHLSNADFVAQCGDNSPLGVPITAAKSPGQAGWGHTGAPASQAPRRSNYACACVWVSSTLYDLGMRHVEKDLLMTALATESK